ncbi:MAG: hypothetical protein AAF420_11415 [Pseudomonadota bacterium]
MKSTVLTISILTGVWLGLSPALAEETLELELDSISIIGNRELPKTITIVPWKKALPGSVLGRPENSVLTRVLLPIDREVFRRELSYYRQIHPLPSDTSQ